ncbi:CS1-pili formation C-terminal domain-containing protein [Pantoea sp. 1.19]|uniref:CS1-pili formation C-terminal domain-containing protein n=1 Tax=Pantoea sp. 1.19 TaxID=1925589 RepID=UPI0011152B1C|nr:CS1-pili formation C-terminal domain-containing protein [Pantoea sp. 1.19]
MNKNITLTMLTAVVAPVAMAGSADVHTPSYIIDGYRFPRALYEMLQSGIALPVLINNKPVTAEHPQEHTFVQIGTATLFITDGKLALKNVKIANDDDNKIHLKDALIEKISENKNEVFDEQMKLPISKDAWFTLDGKKMQLILNISRDNFAALITPREYDIDEPATRSPSGTLAYDFGGYTTHASHGETRNSAYVNFNSTSSVGVDHLILNGSLYTGNSFSSDRDGRINAALMERDYKGFRLAGGMLDNWGMQSVASVSALTGGEIYGFSLGNAANSRKRNAALSLSPVVVFFPTAGEARIRRDGNLLSIQRFTVGSHEIDTSVLPYGIYSVEVEVVSGARTVSREIFQINKPFSADMPDSLKWQLWGGAYNRDRVYDYRHQEENNADHRQVNSATDKAMMSLIGMSVGKSLGVVDWSLSGYMLKNRIISELWASTNLSRWLSINTQAMSASDGSWRGNYGGTLRLPFNIGNIWYNRSQLHSGRFLSLYENKGSNWGISINLPSMGAASGGVISWSEDRDSVYGYKRRRLSYSQGLYAGRYGSVRLRTGISYNSNSYGGYGRNNHFNERERYVMLDYSVPLGNTVSMGVSHSKESGTALNVNASHDFQGDYLKNASANISKSFSGDTERSVTGGATVGFDTPYNSNALSYQTDNAAGWNSTLTSQGSVAWAGTHVGAGKGRESAGVLIDTGLGHGERLTLDIDGSKKLLTGNRNYVSLPPYAKYKMEILNNEDTLESYDINEGSRKTITVYPGNVVYMQPEVKKIITVFGRLMNNDGSVAANREIKNKIGLAKTDANGRFVIDIDRDAPQLSFANNDEGVCSVDINVNTQNKEGALWLGDVACGQQNYVKQSPHGVRENESGTEKKGS